VAKTSWRTWLLSTLATVAAVGVGLVWSNMRTSQMLARQTKNLSGQTTDTGPPAPAQPTQPTIDRTPLDALLRAKAEPPWPDVCTTSDAAVLAQLVNAAEEFAPGAPAQSRARRLATLANVPDTAPERWLIQAR